MFKTLYAFLIALLLVLPANAQGVSSSLGWNTGNNSNIGVDEQVLTPVARPNLPQSRYLDVGPGLTKIDNGSGASFVIGLGPVLSYFLSTGATTNQSAINAILNLSGVTAGDILYNDGTNWSLKHKGANGTFLGIDGSGNLNYGSPSGSGTVTSIDVAVPTWLTPSGGPITGSGTITLANGTGLSNWYVVGTNGSGALDLRVLDANHIPSLDVAKITTGAFAKARQHASTVYNDASNTFSTGTHSFANSANSLILPLKTIGSANGEVSVDTDDLKFNNSSGTTRTAVKTTRQVIAGTGLTGGGDLSADRTLNLSTVPPTLGGTGSTTNAKGDLFVGTGSNTVGKLNVGTDTYILEADSTQSTGMKWAAKPTAGLFKASSIVATARTLPTSGALSGIYIENGSITSSGSYTCAHGTRIYIKGDLTLGSGHTFTVSNKGNGRVASDQLQGHAGGMPGGGEGGIYQAGGGAGGSCAGAGGNGSHATSTYNNGTTPVHGVFMAGGGGGGSGAGSGSATVGGAGGHGGGAVYIEVAGNVSIGESITANGSAGANSPATLRGAGGGGGGGEIYILCTGTISVASGKSVSANGGVGGDTNGSGYKGGGGGGGVVKLWSGGAATITGSTSATGGNKGGGSAGTVDAANGSAGSTDVLQNTAPVSLMMLHSMPLRPIDNVIEFKVKKEMKKCG